MKMIDTLLSKLNDWFTFRYQLTDLPHKYDKLYIKHTTDAFIDFTTNKPIYGVTFDIETEGIYTKITKVTITDKETKRVVKDKQVREDVLHQVLNLKDVKDVFIDDRCKITCPISLNNSGATFDNGRSMYTYTDRINKALHHHCLKNPFKPIEYTKEDCDDTICKFKWFSIDIPHLCINEMSSISIELMGVQYTKGDGTIALAISALDLVLDNSVELEGIHDRHFTFKSEHGFLSLNKNKTSPYAKELCPIYKLVTLALKEIADNPNLIIDKMKDKVQYTV